MAHTRHMVGTCSAKNAARQGLSRRPWQVAVILVMTMFAWRGTTVSAQSSSVTEEDLPRIQVVDSYLEPGSAVFYSVPDLRSGETIYVHASNQSGNVDPFVAVVRAGTDAGSFVGELVALYERALADGIDPPSAVQAVGERAFLAFNDDTGTSSSASLSLRITERGDYSVLLLGSPGQRTFGDVRMVIGVDAPRVLSGAVDATTDTLVASATRVPKQIAAVDERTGTLTEGTPDRLYTLRNLSAGDSVYVYAETTDGDLRPTVVLEDFRTKPLRVANYTGTESSTGLEYTAFTDLDAPIVRVAACCGETPQGYGDYRLVVGINAPDVLSGDAMTTTVAAIVSPKVVKIGVRMDQITGVDQVSENFGAVVDLRMEWVEPALAFNPDDCECFFRTFAPRDFENFLALKGVDYWPIATLYNQQGRRDEQGNVFAVSNDGRVITVSRFSATLQAPDFDFKMFPFDRQTFHIRVRNQFPIEFFVYEPLEGFSGIGQQLGEEEWVVTDNRLSVDVSEGASRFNFTFDAKRHLSFYLYRVLLPLLVIIIISWVLFFLKSYEKRVDASAGNLLLLIAFNFTISGNLPKLGYLTLLDVALITTFVVTAFVLVLNVYLKRLEVAGHRERAESLDKYVIWLYPVLYIVIVAAVVLFYLATET